VAWKRAEVIIDAAKKADFLLIFDCCFAGRLIGSSSRKAVTTRNFEFLGASGANETTISPGEKSFTHALIKALEALSHDKEGFTTTELYLKILQCPTFPKDEQTPCHDSRTNCHERLLLAPLDPPDAMSASTASLSEDQSQPPAIQYCLTVDFLLTNLPTAHDLTELCNSLKILARKKGLPAQKFIWNNMYRKGEEVPLAAKVAALKWRAHALKNGGRTNQRSSSIGEHENATANFGRLGGRSEPCVTAPVRHERLPATLGDAERVQSVDGFRETNARGKKAQSMLVRGRFFVFCWLTSGAILGAALLCYSRGLLPRFWRL
jgi:hypothetical protein